MKWLSNYQQDVSKYVALGGGSGWKHILTEQGLWALLQYRIDFAVYHGSLPTVLKIPLRLLLMIWRKLIEITTGISLPCTAQIGPGLHLPHCGMRVVNARAVIGSDCCISQGVTIGISGCGEMRGVPVVGNRVYIGVNAVVAGKISVGDDVLIGANSLVNRDVPSHCTVLGVPAVVVSEKSSEEYLAAKKIKNRTNDKAVCHDAEENDSRRNAALIP
jgi:serine O-acetyltransferase